MQRKKRKLPLIVAAYDTETSDTRPEHLLACSFPISHQIGIVHKGVELSELTPGNVEDLVEVSIYRHTIDAYNVFHDLLEHGRVNGYLPIICVHNLAFDCHALAAFFDNYECVTCTAKSTQKPLTFTIQDADGEPLLRFWDTLSFAGMSLEKCGITAGYAKACGNWDYSLIRTPETPLTHDEIEYAERDIYALFAWLGYWCRMNPDIDLSLISSRILTKTSVVRVKCENLANTLMYRKRNGKDFKVTKAWLMQNKAERPKTDDELRIMHACTRGGFTYCAARHASELFELDGNDYVQAWDANSMHPFHAVSHMVPEHWHTEPAKGLESCFRYVIERTPEQVMNAYQNPFSVAFHGLFEFDNMRVKAGSIFDRDGISTTAAARMGELIPLDYEMDVSQGSIMAQNHLTELGYHDTAQGVTQSFGKIHAADKCRLFINELSAWELAQVYEWDAVRAVRDGYATTRFCRPTDKDVMSFNTMYKRKQIFKGVKGEYERNGACESVPDFVPAFLADALRDGTADMRDVNGFYMQLKSDLNALYGISITNEAKGEIELTANGLEFSTAGETLDDLREQPKAWYQYGQRIVMWSRIHQLLFMQLTSEHAECYICGDTDSHKMRTTATPEQISRALEPLHRACDKAREFVTLRVRKRWGAEWYPMDGLGHYVHEFSTHDFYAAWNKAYAYVEHGKVNVLLAGVPTNPRMLQHDGAIVEHGIVRIYEHLMNDKGMTFGAASSLLLSYNVTYSHDVTGLNASKEPRWGEWYSGTVTDYLGNSCEVCEPMMKTIYPMSKTIGDTRVMENWVNRVQARYNNPTVNTERLEISWPAIDNEPTFSIFL